MSAFTRLQDGDATDVERLLLESGAEDVPSPGARARTILAIGAATGTAVAVPGAMAKAAASAVAGAGSAKTAGSMTALVLAKWVGTGALLGAVTAACIATVTTPGWIGTHPVEPSVSGPAAAEPAVSRAIARPRTPPAVPNEDVSPTATRMERAPESHVMNSPPITAIGRGTAAPEGVTTGGGSATATTRQLAPSGSGSSVLAEVASLDRARSALGSGDARAALDRLTDHERQFAGGALEPEAVVLEVRALVQLGRRAEATTLANRFLAAHPNSSQGARLRALVGIAPR